MTKTDFRRLVFRPDEASVNKGFCDGGSPDSDVEDDDCERHFRFRNYVCAR